MQYTYKQFMRIRMHVRVNLEVFSMQSYFQRRGFGKNA